MMPKGLKNVFPVLTLVFSCMFFFASFYIGRSGTQSKQAVSARSAVIAQRQNAISQSMESGQQQYQFESDNPIPYFDEEINR